MRAVKGSLDRSSKERHGKFEVFTQRAASEGPRWTRAVEDQSASIPRERTSKLGGSITETWLLR